MLNLDLAPKVITFDCYGTLVQWHAAVRTAIGAVLAGRTGDEQVAALADRFRETAMTLQYQPPYRTYREVLLASLDAVLAEAGFTTDADDGEALLSVLRRIEPHPEVPAALEHLRKRYRLAIISNTDDDLIAGTVAAIGVPFDFVITAEQAQAYKPDHRLFMHAHAAMGVAKEETVHVGMGQFTDLKVCNELGIRSVWIDRIGEAPSPEWIPDATLTDLRGLPDLLLS